MTNETVPELPDWVKVLIDDARQEGWRSGYQQGISYGFTEVRKFIDSEINW